VVTGERDERARFREFVRRAHPDRGGDHDAFVAGLAALRAEADSRHDARCDIRRDTRYDGPVVGGDPPRGVRGLPVRLRRWRDRRFRKPRVR
jgi:hypothetical protein